MKNFLSPFFALLLSGCQVKAHIQIESKPKEQDLLLLPKTCYFINNGVLQETNMICQRLGKEQFFWCIEWQREFDGDVCEDYYDLFMEEYHFGQTIDDIKGWYSE